MSPEADCERVNPYKESTGEGKTGQVRRMFDAIAPGYDLLNRLMTLGIDRRWRRRAIDKARPDGPRFILDVATGTGDLALQMCRRLDPVEVTGIDLSEGMLEVGRRKVARASLADVVTLQQADSLALPFTDRRFDLVTCAFGVRNFADVEAGLREMCRVTRPGGSLIVLELSNPTGRITGPLHRFYSGRIIPLLGRLLARDPSAYTYLPRSVAAVPQGEVMATIMRRAGWQSVDIDPLTFGSATIYHARKAPESEI